MKMFANSIVEKIIEIRKLKSVLIKEKNVEKENKKKQNDQEKEKLKDATYLGEKELSEQIAPEDEEEQIADDHSENKEKEIK